MPTAGVRPGQLSQSTHEGSFQEGEGGGLTAEVPGAAASCKVGEQGRGPRGR